MDFDSWLTDLRQTVTRAEERLAKAREDLTGLRVVSHSPDGAVTATIDHTGRLDRLDIDLDRFGRDDTATLGAGIIAAHNTGRRLLGEERHRFLAEHLEEEHHDRTQC